MRKIVINTFLTLDGVMQSPGAPEEDSSDGFSLGGWSVTQMDEVIGESMGEVMGRPNDLLLGRKTYEIFAGYWPHQDQPPAALLNEATKYVASTTLDRVDWQNSHLLEGDVPDAIRRLKEEDGPELQVHGSAELIQTLLAHDLADEFNIKIYPVVLGEGKRLFGDGTVPANFELTDSKVSTTGVLIATYVRAGDVRTGSFALEDAA